MSHRVFLASLVCGLVNLAGCGGTTDPPVATTVTLSATTLSFSSFGETQQLTATVADQNGATIDDASVTWESSSSSVASVSSMGLVAAVADGTATITATSGSASGTASVTVVTEVIALTGTWLVQTWSVTRESDGLVVDVFNPPSGRVLTDAARYLYDDGTLLSINNFPDTVQTGTEPPDEVFLDASEYLLNTWCVALASDVSFCEGAAADELIIDHGDTDELTWMFVRNGDDMTISGADPYDFGAGDEDATFVMTLDRVIVDFDRPPLVN